MQSRTVTEFRGRRANEGVGDEHKKEEEEPTHGVHTSFRCDDRGDKPNDMKKPIVRDDFFVEDAQKNLTAGRSIYSDYLYGGSERSYGNLVDELDQMSLRSRLCVSVSRFRESVFDSDCPRPRINKGNFSPLQPKIHAQNFRLRPRFKSSSVDKWGRSFSISRLEPLCRSRINMSYPPLPCFVGPSMHAVLYNLEEKYIYNSRLDNPTDSSAVEHHLRNLCFQDPDVPVKRPNLNIYLTRELLPRIMPEEQSIRFGLRYRGLNPRENSDHEHLISTKEKDRSVSIASDDTVAERSTVFSRNVTTLLSPKATSISKFIMIWSNPLYRLYIFMYLMERNYGSLYLFLHSVMRLKAVVIEDPAMLKILAPQIFSRYLKMESDLYIGNCLPDCKNFLAIMIRLVKSSLRSHRIDTFDDIFSLVYYYVFIICTYGPDPNTMSNNETVMEDAAFKPFEDSPECQMLVSDYGLEQIPTSSDIRKTVNRTCILRKDTGYHHGLVTQTLHTLQDIGVVFPYPIIGNAPDVSSTVPRMSYASWSILRAPSLHSQSSLPASTDVDKSGSASSSKQNSQLYIDNPRNVLPPPDNLLKSQKHLHNFKELNRVLIGFSLYCDHCLCKRAPNNCSEADCMHICRVCGYICHKSCRFMVMVPCFEGCKSYALEKLCPDELFPAGHNSCYKERMEAILKEIEVEKRIFEGFQSLMKARKELALKNTVFKKKGESLKSQLEPHLALHRTKMHKLQEKVQRCRLALATTKNEMDLSSSKEEEKDEHKEFATGAVAPSPRQQLVIKSRYCDTRSGTDIVKTVVLNPETKTKDVITHLVNKLHLNESESNYVLLLADKNGSRVPLLPDELMEGRINKDAEDYEILIQKKSGSFGDEESSKSKRDFEIMQTLKELVKSEVEYYNYLVAMRDLFMIPLEKVLDTKEMSAAIFSNLRELISLHERMVSKLKNLTLETKSSINVVLKVYESFIDDFAIYQTYCRNQPLALKLIAKLRASKAGSAVLSRNEAAAKLGKQTLNDLIVKPMQRITRYPLFFRRLSPSTTEDEATRQDITNLVTKLESTINLTNNLMKREEMSSTLAQLDKDINLNGMFPHFSLLCSSRELISIDSFQVVMTVRSTGTRAEFYLMSDMILVGKRKRSGSFTLITAPIMLESATLFTRNAFGAESGHYIRIVDQNRNNLCLKSQSYSEIRSWANLVLTVQSIFRYDVWLYTHIRSVEIYKSMVDSSID